MNIKQIKDAIEEGESLKDLTQAFADIAAEKLKKIRAEAERNREFFQDLSHVFQLINEIAELKGVKPKKSLNKTVCVLLTSNYKFYGNINDPLIRFYLYNTSKLSTDRVVIGQTGLDYFKAMQYFHLIQTVKLQKDIPTGEELKQLVNMIKDYTKVLVFFTEFKSMIVQQPVVRDIAGSVDYLTLSAQNAKPANSSVKQEVQNLNYFLEPEVGEMITFFETQIKTLLLEQTFLESEVSRTASRLISMDQAQSNADNIYKESVRDMTRAKKLILNARLLETIAGAANWRKTHRK